MDSSSNSFGRSMVLQQVVLLSSWWLAFQGLLYILLTDRTAVWLRIHYDESVAGLFNSTGIALLCLALFINRSIREARRQYLAIDTLLLFFLFRSIFNLRQMLRDFGVTWMDWAGLLFDTGLGAALIYYRTRGSEMKAPGTAVGYDALEAVREIKDLVNKVRLGSSPIKAVKSVKLPKSVGPLYEVPASDTPEHASGLAQGDIEAIGTPPKLKSEAVPHLD